MILALPRWDLGDQHSDVSSEADFLSSNPIFVKSPFCQHIRL